MGTTTGAEFKYRMLRCRVYDGDTIMDLVLDLGFGLTITIKGRLYGINTPELFGKDRPDGLAARDYLRARIDDADEVLIETRKIGSRMTGKYGRWLIRVWCDGDDVNAALVDKSFARRATY